MNTVFIADDELIIRQGLKCIIDWSALGFEVIMYIVAYGLLAKTDIFDAFLKGATDGLKIVFRILPTLVGLMVAICILWNRLRTF